MRLELLEVLQRRSSENWLIGLDAKALSDRAAQRFEWLVQFQPAHPVILLVESDPIDFLAGFIAAVAADCPVFLGNPQWTIAEWQQVLDLLQPDCIWAAGRSDAKAASEKQKPQLAAGTIGIPTGGSSGRIRFALHDWDNLTASVAGFRAYFQIDCVSSCCVLPLFHVSGLMQFIRSLCSNGRFALFSSKELEQQIDLINPGEFCISLVPTQLQRLLENPANLDWLTRFQMILLGGAPAWSDLLDRARSHSLRIALTYGMTETASQVVALKPEDFLQGRSGVGQVLPHAQLMVCDAEGKPIAPGQPGTIHIRAKSLCRAYLPPAPDASPEQIEQLCTDDLGYFDTANYLHLIGRSSQKIITGGENVFPAEVEAAIRQTGLVQDVCVIGLPDRTWGEAVTALIVPGSDLSIADLETALQPRLSRYKQPKQWLIVDRIPRNPQGKLNYEQIRKKAIARLDN